MVVYIIVPVYNVEKYLKRCLDSLFCQTYKDYLIICVNDGSTDSSISILEEFLKKHKRNMVILDKPNGGLSSARNEGLNYIKDYNDSYITFLDSDDWVKKDYLEVLVNQMEESGADIVCSSYYSVHENEEINIDNQREIKKTYCSSFDSIKLLFNGKIQSHSPCKLYKSSLWRQIRFDESKCFMEDQVITFQLFANSKNILLIDYMGYFYLHRLGSLCQSKMTNKKVLSALESYIFNYNYKYSMFNDEQVDIIHKEVIQLFANIYLMMYPRFDTKIATKDELDMFKRIVAFEKEHKAIKLFRAYTKKQNIKKWIYLLFRPLYKFLFSFFLKEYDY